MLMLMLMLMSLWFTLMLSYASAYVYAYAYVTSVNQPLVKEESESGRCEICQKMLQNS